MTSLMLVVAVGLAYLAAKAYWAIGKGIRDGKVYNIHLEEMDHDEPLPYWASLGYALMLTSFAVMAFVSAVLFR